MRRALATAAVAGAVALAPLGATAAVAEDGAAAHSAAPVVLAQDVDDDGVSETGRWGLAGLAGLFGLFGYRKYRDHRAAGTHDGTSRRI